MVYNPCNTQECKNICDSYAVRCEEIAVAEAERCRRQLDSVRVEVMKLEDLIVKIDDHIRSSDLMQAGVDEEIHIVVNRVKKRIENGQK
jgi:hypothetical protein